MSYTHLIRNNTNFRRLWFGDMVSLLGDWFNTIAIYSLINTLTGSPLALGLVFISKLLPFALASLGAGVLVDRYNRRQLMIASDLLRAVIVLGFLLVREPQHVYIIYVLSALQVTVGAVFIPARSASIPNITSKEELLTANTLMAATWSSLLAIGAALGGVATEWLGLQAVFIINCVTYLISAQFIFRTRIPQETEEPQAGGMIRLALRQIGNGWKHMRTHPYIGRIVLAKGSWALGGGALVYMLALLGEEIFPHAGAMGIGILFAARGIGTGIGPVLTRSWFKDEKKWPSVLGGCMIFSGIMYLAVGFAPVTLWVAALVVLAHAASGTNWVLSTVLLQQRTQDSFRGRVFSTEWLFVTLADTVAILTASLVLEYAFLNLAGGFRTFAAVQIGCGLLWFALVVPAERMQ